MALVGFPGRRMHDFPEAFHLGTPVGVPHTVREHQVNRAAEQPAQCLLEVEVILHGKGTDTCRINFQQEVHV